MPDSYLGVTVPAVIAGQWKRWEGAQWRKTRHHALNQPHPPDQRFSVVPPGGMCQLHLDYWRRERDRMFDPVRGSRWPGHPGSPFEIIDRDLNRERERRRAEWDDKASEQMRLTEECCTSGRSPQCDGPRTCTGCRMLTCRCPGQEVA